MDFIFVIYLFIPIAIVLLGKVIFPHHITAREWGIQALVTVVLLSLSLLIFNGLRYSNANDTEIWNGRITAMSPIQKNCQTGWSRSKDNFCTEYRTRSVYVGQTCTGTGTEEVCVSNYETEYEYNYPWERRYFIESEIGNYEIYRIDRQGVNTPPVFAAKEIGDPVSRTSNYSNWINGAADSLFKEDPDLSLDLVYPLKVYDYFEIDRFVWTGVEAPPNVDDYNKALSAVLGQVGPSRQMNAVVIVTNSTYGDTFPYAVRKHWRGFKKNDAAIFVMVNPNDLTIETSYVLSWSKENLFNVQMENSINDHRGKALTPDIIADSLLENADTYERRSMKEFEYLKDQIPVPPFVYILIAIINVFGSIATLVYFVKTDN
jgi:hypothetical protein